jgi:uncharacterized protein YecT (DUF1311 family)
VALVLGPVAAAADPAMECDGASQVETGACVTATLARVDAALDQAFGFARGAAQELDETTGRAVALPALEASQAAWSAWRDAQCDFVGTLFGGGSGTGIAIESCRIELGREQTAALMGVAG